MKKSRYNAEQIAFALRQAESGTPVPEVYRKMGISEQTFYRWKKKFARMGVTSWLVSSRAYLPQISLAIDFHSANVIASYK